MNVQPHHGWLSVRRGSAAWSDEDELVGGPAGAEVDLGRRHPGRVEHHAVVFDALVDPDVVGGDDGDVVPPVAQVGLGPGRIGRLGHPDAGRLRAAFKDRRQGPKTLLLDQRIVAGLGNIYVCEALHMARISPLKPAAKVTRPKIEALVEAIRAVLAEAIEAGGSTLRDYAGADGALGYFQHRFKVYGREGEPCLRNDGGVIRRVVQAGRSTFFCPVCQK